MSEVIFFLAAIMAIAGALGVIMLRNPFYAVLSLVGHLLALAALFLLLQAQFVAAAQVVIYAGAVMVLYVFVVAYVGGDDASLGETSGGTPRDRHPRRQGRPGLRVARPDRRAAAHQVPAALRARLDPAAAGGRRRRRARPPPARPRPLRRARRPRRPPRPATRLHRHDGRGRRRPRRCGRRAGRVRAGRRAGHDRGRVVGVDIGWYLAVSALIFCIGAAGVLTKRNPLVILLCLELMLNAANLSLIAFSRMWGNGEGQVFAIVVMVVAPQPAGRRGRAARAPGMSA